MLVVLLLFCCSVAVIGARIAATELHPWYLKLAKPRFEPPTWLFTPVWIAFYVIMAIAVWMVWRTRSGRFRVDGMVLFCIQLCLNLAWVIAFFHLHRLLVAVIVILGLWFAAAFTTALFWQVRRRAGALMFLCLGLISYVIGLNLVLLRLN